MPDSRGGVCPRYASNRPAREHAIAFCCGARKNAVLFADSRIAAVIPAQAGIHLDLRIEKKNGSRPAPG
jgi:hypothetical protein